MIVSGHLLFLRAAETEFHNGILHLDDKVSAELLKLHGVTLPCGMMFFPTFLHLTLFESWLKLFTNMDVAFSSSWMDLTVIN